MVTAKQADFERRHDRLRSTLVLLSRHGFSWRQVSDLMLLVNYEGKERVNTYGGREQHRAMRYILIESLLRHDPLDYILQEFGMDCGVKKTWRDDNGSHGLT